MTRILTLFTLSFFLFQSCAQDQKQIKAELTPEINLEVEALQELAILIPSGTTLETRIQPPTDFTRTKEEENSFATYLRQLPLKPDGEEVLLYDGSIKRNYNTYAAVVDMSIGDKNLHQCADAVMRLRAEYLWNEKRYDEIHFNFTNGFRVDYSKWMEGRRIVVKGNKSYWVNRTSPSNNYQDFWKYMELIFSYAGTLSLSKELVPVKLTGLKVGDVFIWGGSPGHAILVVDLAENVNTNEKVFLLTQSYMPAQETQILQNPNNSKLSPWYSVSEIGEELVTPEWTFKREDLKRFAK